ncbi:MAG: HK97 family phage prohead protease [Deltaproteobacteria bacterium]|nr:HK97 family phage prohead protease [Deltaproteobacteria bacterium]
MPDQNPVYKATLIKSVNESDRTARFIASDESIDRYGDIIVASGWDVTNFKENPQFLFGHKSHQLPIGRVSKTWQKGKNFMADVEFTPLGMDDFADKCFNFLKAGFLKAVSVGFMPISREPIYDDEGRYIGTKFLKQELLELSLVPIPANANALQVAKGFNFSDKDLDLFFQSDKGRMDVQNARFELENLQLRHSR